MARRYKANPTAVYKVTLKNAVEVESDIADALIKNLRAARRKAGLDEDDVIIVQPELAPDSIILCPFSEKGHVFVDSMIASMERAGRTGDN